MTGASSGSVRSSTSKEIQHCREKYSLGSIDISGQNPPKDSACSSRRSNQYGAQPPPDSSHTTFRVGWRSNTPKATSCA